MIPALLLMLLAGCAVESGLRHFGWGTLYWAAAFFVTLAVTMMERPQ